ncbi:MAG: MgtC/SapB family protein [Alistipes indistinctus]
MLGAVIGLDREYRARRGGLPHALPRLAGQRAVHDRFAIRLRRGARRGRRGLDPSRVAAQIVSGIGFLGAGTIIFQKQFVRGLTTAAQACGPPQESAWPSAAGCTGWACRPPC